MADGFGLGLLRWGYGQIRLSHWDSLHGDDVHWVIDPDGQVKQVEDSGDGQERLVSTDLGADLIRLLERLEAENDDFSV